VKKVGDGRGFVVAVFRPHAELSMQSICKLYLMGNMLGGVSARGGAALGGTDLPLALTLLNKF
jgi:hypothetical protein